MTMFLLILLLAVPTDAAADPSDATDLSATAAGPSGVTDSIYSITSTQYSYEWMSNIQAWQNRKLSVELSFPSGTIVTNVVQQQRFGENELSGDAHYWMDLWGESYGHVHGSVAPNALTMPQGNAGGELYEVVSDWEFSDRFE